MVAISVAQLLGPMLIGVLFNMILYGIFLMQAYTYYQAHKPDEGWWIKYFIMYLFVVEAFDTGAGMSIVFEPLILKFGQPAAVEFFPKMFWTRPLTVVAISTPIQIFFAWRIKVLTESIILALTVVALSLASFGSGLYTAVLVFKFKLFARKKEFDHGALSWLLTAAAADILIAIILVKTLSKHRTGFVPATDDAVSKIIRITIQTGMLTSIFAVLDVIFFMSVSFSSVNFTMALFLSKLYANCLLSQLNARAELRDKLGYKSRLTNVSTGQGMSFSDIYRQQENTVRGGRAHTFDAPTFELEHQRRIESGKPLGYGIEVTKSVDARKDPFFPEETQ